MRVAGNKIRHLLVFYHTELKALYPSEEIDALFELAAEHYLGFTQHDTQTKKEENLNQSDLIKLYDCCKELSKHRPIQYILGEAHFYGSVFKVNENVLIPRPETEELVDLILKETKHITSVLDLGTGSGCIPLSIKKNQNSANIFACDISEGAIELAQKNAKDLALEINFFKADVLDALSIKKHTNEKFEIIVSNPPYINILEKDLMEKHVLDHEPHLALFVNDVDDIIFYKKIIDLCKETLNSGGKLYFELNPLTSRIVKEYAIQSNQFIDCELLKDMSGKLRFFRGIKE
jgi:release factor glutamine methyltransferase